jgi:hypothetical protein
MITSIYDEKTGELFVPSIRKKEKKIKDIYFPKEIFSLIINYCGPTIEQKQNILWKSIKTDYWHMFGVAFIWADGKKKEGNFITVVEDFGVIRFGKLSWKTGSGTWKMGDIKNVRNILK